MVITKTKFINYIRCPRFCALDDLRNKKLDTEISLKDYRDEEYFYEVNNMLGDMRDDEGNDLIDVLNPQLEIMMPYYNKVEILCGNYIDNYFKTKAVYSSSTLNQESFDFQDGDTKYLCYVDIYNERKDGFDIIEVKATTSKKYLELGKKDRETGKIESIFIRDGEIYKLREEISNDEMNMKIDDYKKQKAKLFDKYTGVGHYVYDLAVQRYIIEQDLKNSNRELLIPNIKYYLGVLNCDYIYDGYMENKEHVYNTDVNNENIISLFDMTNITREYMDKIKLDFARVKEYVEKLDGSKYNIGKYCEYKKTTKCKYVPLCFKNIPKYNSILNYLNNHHGFKDELGNKYETYELINKGIVSMLDVPENYLNRKKNIIQRESVLNNSIYIIKDKIKAAINEIKYPIYHLDFETFPCPLPRNKGEKCYTQSVFQFSLHIEREAGVCDKYKDHYEFLVKTHNDEREELIKKMCEWIGETGTVLVYNESFEKSRLKELSVIFPEYKDKLLHIRDMVYDLMYIVNTNTKMYTALGFDEEEASMFNYYNSKLSGSFSIKKVLPIFTDLTYENMPVGNGMEALVAYAKYNKLSKEEHTKICNDLISYCQQDTWAMVEILRGLRNLVK